MPAGAAPARHPRGLYVLFFTEMWERFSFYLMQGLLFQFLVDSESGGMGWDKERSSSIFGSYIGLVYFMPFLGGLAADRWLGYRTAITAGGLSMLAGHILLAFPGEAYLYLGLLALSVGCGFFKPNISTLVGNLYPAGSPLRDAGYNIFYMGINLGAFSCNFVAAVVRNQWGWHAAFATAAVGMAFSLVIFWSWGRTFAHADTGGARQQAVGEQGLFRLVYACLLPAATAAGLGWYLGGPDFGEGGILKLGETTTAFLFACVPVAAFYIWVWLGLEDRKERGRVAALFVIFIAAIFFWTIFYLSGTALTDWAVKMTDRQPSRPLAALLDAVPGGKGLLEPAPPSYFENAGAETPTPRAGESLKVVNAEIFQSVNPGFILLLTPLLVAFWAFLRSRGREPSTPSKIGLGLLFIALSMVVMLGAVWFSQATTPPGGKTSPWWLIGTYACVTVGELCLSPMGLSLVSKNSPARIRAFLMGGWFVATSVGGKLSGLCGEIYQRTEPDDFFLVLAGCTALAGGAVFCALPWLRRQLAD